MTLSTTETAKPNALEMFRMGNDYIQIAAYFKSSEAEVEKLIHLLRSRERIALQKADWQDKRKEERKVYMREYMRRQRAENRQARAQR
jgi:hypothetical protein